MDQGVNGAADGAPITMVEPAASVRGRRRALTGDLTILAVVGVLLVGAVAAGGAAVYQQFYSPTAFVTRYLEMLAEGRASDALAVPGVSVDAAVLDAAGLPTTSSDALLRSAALGGLSDARVLSEAPRGDDTVVTVAYESGGHAGTTSYLVERAGWIGVVPAWRFAQSPLSIVDLTVRGSMGFSVNGFEVDKRQVSVDPAGADPLAAIPLLVFTPGVYVIAVDTSISTARGSPSCPMSRSRTCPWTCRPPRRNGSSRSCSSGWMSFSPAARPSVSCSRRDVLSAMPW